VLDDPASLELHDGDLVTLRGPLFALKAPTILGVHVANVDKKLHGNLVQSTGILKRQREPLTVSPWDSVALPMGDHYVLWSVDKPGHLAQVIPLEQQPR
jgi:hypothetical protein